jgi:cob(I)alamin adenosyltransferase
VVGLGQETALDPLIIEYLNRLSDFLFVLARTVNYREGIEEIQW